MRSDRAARAASLILAVLVGAVALQLLLMGLELPAPFRADQVRQAADWVTERPREGALMLAGVALALVGLWLLWSFLAGLRARPDAVTVRRRHGWTRIDCPTLADAIERELDRLDTQSRISVAVKPSGRINVKLTTADPSVTGPVREVRQRLAELVAARHLPCTVGRIEIAAGPRRGPRVR